MNSVSTPTIWVIVLNYNRQDLLEHCLSSIDLQTTYPDKVLVLDNGSDGFDMDRLRVSAGRARDRLEFHRFDSNLGYCKAMNWAFSRILTATEPPGWVMTLNNDTELDLHFFEKLKFELSRTATNIGMLAPKVRAMRDRNVLDATGISLCLDAMSTARGQLETDESQYDFKTRILIPNGVAAIYKTELLRDVGDFYEPFFAYCEDTDLGLRAWTMGWECRFIPECIVYHMRSASTSSHGLWKLYQVERNHYWVAFRNFPFPLLILLPWITAYRYFWQVIAVVFRVRLAVNYSNANSLRYLAKATIQGAFDALIGIVRNKMWIERSRILRLQRRSQSEILSTLVKKRLKIHELILKS